MMQPPPVVPPDPSATVSVVDLLRIHQPRFVPGVAGQTNDTTYCRECSRMWPCKTAMLAGVMNEPAR